MNTTGTTGSIRLSGQSHTSWLSFADSADGHICVAGGGAAADHKVVAVGDHALTGSDPAMLAARLGLV